MVITLSSSKTRLLSGEFSNHLVCLNTAYFLQMTASSHSHLPPYDQQPMD